MKQFDILLKTSFESLNSYNNAIKEYYVGLDLERAEKYWKTGNLSGARTLYEENYDSLTKLQKKRLEYIRGEL